MYRANYRTEGVDYFQNFINVAWFSRLTNVKPDHTTILYIFKEYNQPGDADNKMEFTKEEIERYSQSLIDMGMPFEYLGEIAVVDSCVQKKRCPGWSSVGNFLKGIWHQ
jgi:hypothetical protein